MVIASPSLCMRRCMQYSTLLACHRLSRSRFKAWSGEFHRQHGGHLQNIEQKVHRSQKGARASRGVFQGPNRSQTTLSARSKGKNKRSHRSPSRNAGAASSADSSGSESPCSSASEANHSCGSKDSDKGWDARRRDPRVNGADIYVARFTKNGTGTAKPCWRCLEWCRWAGVKRIFHWNAVEGRFEVVKVNSAQNGQYETHADIRLFAGLGW